MDWKNNTDWILTACTAVAIVGGAIALIVKGFRWVKSRLRLIDHFLEGWNGEPARPGFPRRPGVLERLEVIERRLANVENQVKPNGGGSLRDSIDRIEKKIES